MNITNMINIYYVHHYFIMSEQEAKLQSDYRKMIEVNGVLQKWEFYENNELKEVSYFLRGSVTMSSVFEEYPSLNHIIFYKNETVSGAFKKYDVETYNRSLELLVKRIQVFKNYIQEIYDSAIDIVTNTPLFVIKTYLDYEKVVKYEFTYMPNGDFEYLAVFDINDYYHADNSSLFWDMIATGNNEFGFRWNGFEYYQNASPILPTGGIPV